MASSTSTHTRGDATRAALISAGTVVFGRDGFEGASTRAIADAASVQQALIGFHFGGKEGLYLAVFDDLARKLERRLGPTADAIEKALESTLGSRKGTVRSRSLALLLGLVDDVVAVLVRDDAAQAAQLISREQQTPTRAFEILYERFFGRMTGLITRLVLSVRGGGTALDARLTAVSIMGQMLVFRLSRAVVLRHLGWTTMGEGQVAALRAHLHKTIASQLLVAVPRLPPSPKPRRQKT